MGIRFLTAGPSMSAIRPVPPRIAVAAHPIENDEDPSARGAIDGDGLHAQDAAGDDAHTASETQGEAQSVASVAGPDPCDTSLVAAMFEHTPNGPFDSPLSRFDRANLLKDFRVPRGVALIPALDAATLSAIRSQSTTGKPAVADTLAAEMANFKTIASRFRDRSVLLLNAVKLMDEGDMVGATGTLTKLFRLECADVSAATAVFRRAALKPLGPDFEHLANTPNETEFPLFDGLPEAITFHKSLLDSVRNAVPPSLSALSAKASRG
jgi:hypothetical protein